MIIDCISDLHGHYPELEGGDLLIVAGDLTARDDYQGWLDFAMWIAWPKYKKKIVIGGNHDGWLVKNPPNENTFGDDCSYLCDSGTEFEYEEQIDHPQSTATNKIDMLLYKKKKLKIWGSPWTLAFEGMNPHCKAFTVETEEELAEKWKLIPDDVDILVTHSPPRYIGDWIRDYNSRIITIVGSESLYEKVQKMSFLKLHVYGHVHEGFGKRAPPYKWENQTVSLINASHVNENYEPVNKPIRIEL